MLLFDTDTTKGHHDALISACNPARYVKMGCDEEHASCEENYRIALENFGGDVLGDNGAPKIAPTPFNLFMNVQVSEDERLIFRKPTSRQEESVVFKALTEVIIVLSACPMDQTASEEWLPQPRDVAWQVFDGFWFY